MLTLRNATAILALQPLMLVACGDGDASVSPASRGGDANDVGGNISAGAQPSAAGRSSNGGTSSGGMASAGGATSSGGAFGGVGAVAGAVGIGGAAGSGASAGKPNSGGTTAGGAVAGGSTATTGGTSMGGSAQGGTQAGGAVAKGGSGASGVSAAVGGIVGTFAGSSALGGNTDTGGTNPEPAGGNASIAGGNAGSPGSSAGGTGGGEPGSGGFAGTAILMDGCDGHFKMESLDRGLVAVVTLDGVYVGWRMSGCEYDPVAPTRISYKIYRDGDWLATVTDSTNYLDATGTATSRYVVRAIIDGVERSESASVIPWSQNYLRIPIDIPPAGIVDRIASGQTDSAYTYDANDGSPGDLDGDGDYELVLKWDPTNSRDNSFTGFTGNVIVDGYQLNGARLWRIDLGKNIRAGAHYTQFVVYDFDGDGRAEVAMKTAPGTRDGTGQFLHTGPAATDNDAEDDRNIDGRVLTGAEYLTIFDGRTGAEVATAVFQVARGVSIGTWGDTTGNRADRFLSSAGFVSDSGSGTSASGSPSILMARGYYERTTMTAWNWRGAALSRIWTYDSYNFETLPPAIAGQGAHSMAVADVDADGAQEIVYGAAVMESDGTAKCSTAFGHGDALHVTDLVPSRPGLEVFMPHENVTLPSYDVHDARTCEVIVTGPVRGTDTGRGAADDISPDSPGAELWTSGSSLMSATTGASVGTIPTSSNFLVWWDGDESRELLDGITVSKYKVGPLFSCPTCNSNNGTKSTPVLTADLLGDWREEIVWRTYDNSALMLYTTTTLTARRLYTLMHDPQYRMQVSSEQTAYNQPPHTSFHIGTGMATPPKPDIGVR